MPTFRKLLRVLLVTAAAIGLVESLLSAQRVRTLQTNYQRLVQSIGAIPVDDPSQVWLAGMRLEQPWAWQFRAYLPANYEPGVAYAEGRISATSPRAINDSSGWSGGSSASEPQEVLLTVAFLEESGGWSIHTNGVNSRGVSSLDPQLQKMLQSPEPPVVEMAAEKQAAAFSPDEPICLLRIRGRNAVRDQDTTDPLFPGYYLYLVPRPQMPTFQALQRQTFPAAATPAREAP